MPPKYHDVRDVRILGYSNTDWLLGRGSFRGIIGFGDPDSGKSSTSRNQYFAAMLEAGYGALCCTTKRQDTDDYARIARECGREKDLLVFSPTSGHCYDAIAHEWNRTSGRGAQDVETIVDFFDTLLSLGKNYSSGGDQRFFELASQQVTRVACHLIKLAQELLSIPNIAAAISSFPNYPGEIETDEWRESAYTAKLILKIKERESACNDDEWDDLKAAISFVERWASLDERPRSSIAMTFSGMADRYIYNPWKKLFASGICSWTPWDITHNGLIAILDFPVNEMGKEGARLCQSAIKLSHQRDWLRHAYTPGCCNGAVLVQDEFQTLITKYENNPWAQTARASGVASLYYTQNLLNLAEELGETQPGAKTKAFLANIGTKLMHRCTCVESGTYFADLVGKAYQPISNYGSSRGGLPSANQVSVGGAFQQKHLLDPLELTTLMRPDSVNPLSAAIVYAGGDHFNATRTESCPQGRNYLRVHFSR